METIFVELLSASGAFLLSLDGSLDAALTEHMATCCRAGLSQLVQANWATKCGFFRWQWWHFNWEGLRWRLMLNLYDLISLKFNLVVYELDAQLNCTVIFSENLSANLTLNHLKSYFIYQ